MKISRMHPKMILFFNVSSVSGISGITLQVHPKKKVHNIFYEARVHPVHSELPREHFEEVIGLHSKNIWSYKLLNITYFIIFTLQDECININLHFYIFNYNDLYLKQFLAD